MKESKSKGVKTFNKRQRAFPIEVSKRSRRSMAGITRVISFTSGKGGVGKTHTVLNTAIALAQMGRSVLVLDADLGLANINIMLGVKPTYTIEDLLNGNKSLEEIIISGPEGISIIPGASGVESICDLGSDEKLLLMDAVESLSNSYDYLLIDTRAGVSQDVMYFNSAAAEVICIINNEPTSLTDAYALIKILSQSYGERKVSIIANDVSSDSEGIVAFKKLYRCVSRFLPVQLNYLGYIASSDVVNEAIMSQTSLMLCFPSSEAARCIRAISSQIDEDFINSRVKGGMQFFFKQLLDAGMSSDR
ncbi:MAG: MinD/ParA family protein [SAR324 cluster bacterium]|uniref:MinD/ParA family protein n=1 Tax=SAR324 cluster bacterium TaxID=2024889 RepID=A0A7X9FQN4_9DELT|nr:MinD/ParA family protein [SAR324 cluster bacterium]